MMQFETFNFCTSIATNSLKPVRIVRYATGEYGRSDWMVYTPEGGLNDNRPQRGPFATFNEAKRNAEADVGVSINWDEVDEGNKCKQGVYI